MARKQKITSAATSVNMLPKLFSKMPAESALFERGSINIDIGGGKYETATDFMHAKGVHNFVYDPFNRSEEHNERVWDLVVADSFADTATLSNVLNVIQLKRDRIGCLMTAAQALREDGVCFITVYEGNRSGKGKKTSKGFQLNRPVRDYVSEVEEVFRDVEVMRGGIIVARDPKV
jgi:hypothetical protein